MTSVKDNRPVPMAGILIDEEQINALRERATRASAMLKELANEQRLLILCRLMEGECAVGDLSAGVGLSQSATSQHLARMRDAGLLETRRDAQSIFYRIVDQKAARLLEALCEVYDS